VNAAASVSDRFRITGVIVVPGVEAPSAERSPYIMRPYPEELVQCQRYFESFTANNQYSFISTFQNAAGNYYTSVWYFRTRKRTTPAFTLASGSTWNTVPNVFPGIDAVGFDATGYSYVLLTTAGNVAAFADARL
jgi:hypothetical protein